INFRHHIFPVMEDKKGFLDDTTLSKTPKSPLRTSTVVRPDANRQENFAKRLAMKEMNASFLPRDDPTFQALSEVTNIRHFSFPKPKFNATVESSFADSSLGILQMDNFSDLETSLQGSIFTKTTNNSKKIERESKSRVLEEEFLKFQETNSKNVKDTEENDRNSSPDIEYDGTNIPELNLEYDALAAFQTSSTSAPKTSFAIPKMSLDIKDSCFETSYVDENNINDDLAEQSKESFNAEPAIENSKVTRDSLFEVSISYTNISKLFDPSYDSIFKVLMPDGRASDDDKVSKITHNMKICSFLDDSSRLQSILENQSLAEQNFLKKLEELSVSSSIKFCPEEMSARSTSFRSSSPTTVNSHQKKVFH
ncbi:centrosomal protein, partial [Caerostris extrusa]